jgi:hypothetical protein
MDCTNLKFCLGMWKKNNENIWKQIPKKAFVLLNELILYLFFHIDEATFILFYINCCSLL